MSMEEGEITEWRVAEGGKIAVGDEFCDIETSKIVNTAESPVAGTLVRIVGQPGQTLSVGALLGVVADGKASKKDIDEFVASFVPDAGSAGLAKASVTDGSASVPAPASVASEPAAATVESAAPTANASELAEGPDDSGVKASVVARRIAAAHNINLNNVTPTGRHGRVSKTDVENTAGIRVVAAPLAVSSSSAESTPRSTEDDSRIAATPVARRLAKKLNINLHDVTPSGRRGRVTRGDIEAAAIALSGVADYREDKLNGMRKTIAARLSESKQTIPHYRVSVDIDIDSLLQQRKYMNEELGHSLSVNDFLIKACASALTRVPEVNVQYTGEAIRYFDQVDISMAVAIEGGLITPVIRDVARKGLPQIAAEAGDLAERAQAGTLGIDEFQGGTFSISNLGMFGVDQFDAVINLPQAAILAVAAGKRKPVVKGDQLVPATVMRVSLSSDHRAIDGATAAQFLQALKGFVENPASMLL